MNLSFSLFNKQFSKDIFDHSKCNKNCLKVFFRRHPWGPNTSRSHKKLSKTIFEGVFTFPLQFHESIYALSDIFSPHCPQQSCTRKKGTSKQANIPIHCYYTYLRFTYSSAPLSTRIKSTHGGIILSKRRAQLSDDNFMMQLLLKINQKFWKGEE